MYSQSACWCHCYSCAHSPTSHHHEQGLIMKSSINNNFLLYSQNLSQHGRWWWSRAEATLEIIAHLTKIAYILIFVRISSSLNVSILHIAPWGESVHTHERACRVDSRRRIDLVVVFNLCSLEKWNLITHLYRTDDRARESPGARDTHPTHDEIIIYNTFYIVRAASTRMWYIAAATDQSKA